MTTLNVGTLSLDVVLNTAPFHAGITAVQLEAAAAGAKTSAALGATGAAATGAAARVGALGGAFSGAGKVMAGVFAGGLIVSQIKQTAGAASDLNEAVNMTGLVFGANKQRMLDWAKTGADAFGLAQTDALQAAAGYANLFQNVGVSLDQSTAYSQQLVQLSADMASAFNTSVPDAISAISSGLRGEAEPLRRYGIMLDDVTLKNKAMTMGLFSGKGVLDQNAKAQAAYAIILEKSAKFAGDFKNTSKDPANAARILDAEIQNLRASIGQDLLPLLKQMLGIASGTIKWANDHEQVVKAFIRFAGTIAAIIVVGKTWRLLNEQIAKSNIFVGTTAQVAGTEATVASGRAVIGLAAVGAAVKSLIAIAVPLTLISAEIQAIADSGNIADAQARAGGNALETGAMAMVNLMDKTVGVFGAESPWHQDLQDFYTAVGMGPDTAGVDAAADATTAAADAAAAAAAAMGDFGAETVDAGKKATDAIQAFQDKINSTTTSVLSANGLFGEPVGQSGQAGADTAVKDASQQLADAQAKLALARRDYRAGSREIVDAERAVTDASTGLADARHAADQAHGLSAGELAKRAGANRTFMQQQARDLQALEGSGLGAGARMELKSIEEQYPGTIHRLVQDGINKPFVTEMNKSFTGWNGAGSRIAESITVAQAEIEAASRKAGFAAATAYSKGFTEGTAVAYGYRDGQIIATPVTGDGMGPNSPGLTGGAGGIVIHGGVTVQAENPAAFQAKLDAQARQRAVAGR
jgi:hypothetical protein